ncbi:glycosyltransferase family 4 protein [Candidatus Halobeggiatoa sp. HSG11]|nr:glycosyltransferase family 4 protein [Candidatus Halobeggiatoa sp. HSG11]
MHLVIVIRHFYPFTRPSGVISFVNELVLELKKREIKLTILCLRKKGEKNEYTYNGIRIIKFNQLHLLNYRKKIQCLEPDKILFISSLSSGIRLPLWWFLLASLSRKFNLYFYQTTNSLKINNKFFLKYIFSIFSGRFVANDALYNEFSNNLNLDTKIIYPGVSRLEKLHSYHGKGINNLGFFGHISFIKGVDIFVKLAIALPEHHFYLVAGKGGKKDDILYHKFLKDIPLIKNMQYIGFTEKPFDIMKQCDLLILPYRHGGTILGVAQSAIEAMAMGIPVIGSKNAALEPLIKNGVNGFFCEGILEITAKIKLLDNNPDLYCQLSQAAQRTVQQHFTINKIANQLLEYIS